MGTNESERPQMENPQSDVLTVDEAAAFLKIPRSSVYKLAQQGKLPGQKVGRHWRFYRPKLVSMVSGETIQRAHEVPGE